MIRLSKSTIGEEEKRAVVDILNKEYLGMGEEVKLFEEELGQLIDTEREVVCVNSGTAALHLSVQCLGLGKDDEVLVPTIAYVACFQSVSATGATPVACDVLSDSLFIDVDDAAARVTPNTKAIMPVHYASDASALDEVYTLANRRGLRVIEDAAHAFGCQRNGKYVGCTGDIVCFSFDGIKNITAGEGGAVISSDAELVKSIKDARLLGVQRDTEKRYNNRRSWGFDVSIQGYRYHMSNIMAAIGRSQLRKLAMIRETRKQLARRYLDALRGLDEVEFLDLDYEHIVPHIFVVKIKGGKRDRVMDYLLQNSIECGIHYYPNHWLSKFRTEYSLPAAEQAYKEVLSLPLHLDLSEEQQAQIISALWEFEW
jgi:dTDP-4-amino-4,6-dideoxygalactose transaminase